MKLLWMVAGIALASATAANAADEDEDDAPQKEKVVCKTEKITGSRIKSKRTCMTQKQWDEVAASARKGVDDLVRDSARALPSAPTGPGGL